MFDFVEEQLGGREAIKFKRAKTLVEYSEKRHKVFPPSRANENAILKAFLHIKDHPEAKSTVSSRLQQSRSPGTESSMVQHGQTARREHSTPQHVPLRLKISKAN